eukprot:Partr_v1_DN28907_c2_g1_i2_m25868 putative Autophagy related
MLQALNSFLPPSFPLRLSEGTISSISVSIPWMNIWSQDCEMQIDAVHLVGYIVGNESLYRHDDQEMMAKSSRIMESSAFMQNSIHVAGDFMKEEVPDTDKLQFLQSPALSVDGVNDPGSEGISILASLIDHIMSRLKVSVDHVTVDLRLSETGSQSLSVSLTQLKYQDDTSATSDPSSPNVGSSDAARLLLPFISIKSVRFENFSIYHNDEVGVKHSLLASPASHKCSVQIKKKRSDSSLAMAMTTIDVFFQEWILWLDSRNLACIQIFAEALTTAAQLLSEVSHELETTSENTNVGEASIYHDTNPSPFNSFQQHQTDFSFYGDSPPSPRSHLKSSSNLASSSSLVGSNPIISFRFQVATIRGFVLKDCSATVSLVSRYLSDELSRDPSQFASWINVDHLMVEFVNTVTRAVIHSESDTMPIIDISIQKALVHEWLGTQETSSSKPALPCRKYYPIVQFSDLFNQDMNIAPFSIVDGVLAGLTSAVYSSTSRVKMKPTTGDISAKIGRNSSGPFVEVRTKCLHIAADLMLPNRLRNLFPASTLVDEGMNGSSSSKLVLKIMIPILRTCIFTADISNVNDLIAHKVNNSQHRLFHSFVEGIFEDCNLSLNGLNRDLISFSSSKLFMREFASSSRILLFKTAMQEGLSSSLRWGFYSNPSEIVVNPLMVSDFKSNSKPSDADLRKFAADVSYLSSLHLEFYIGSLASSITKSDYSAFQLFLNAVSLQNMTMESDSIPTQQTVKLVIPELDLVIAANDSQYRFYSRDFEFFLALSLSSISRNDYLCVLVKDLILTAKRNDLISSRSLLTPLNTSSSSASEAAQVALTIYFSYDREVLSNSTEIAAKTTNTVWTYGLLSDPDNWKLNDTAWISDLTDFISTDPPEFVYVEETESRYTQLIVDIVGSSVLVSSRHDNDKHGMVALFDGRISSHIIQNSPSSAFTIDISKGELGICSLEPNSRSFGSLTAASRRERYMGLGYVFVLDISNARLIRRSWPQEKSEIYINFELVSILVQADTFKIFLKRLGYMFEDDANILSSPGSSPASSIYLDVLEGVDQAAFSSTSALHIPEFVATETSKTEIPIIDDYFGSDSFSNFLEPSSSEPTDDDWKSLSYKPDRAPLPAAEDCVVRSLISVPLQFDDNFFAGVPVVKSKESDSTATIKLRLQKLVFRLKEGISFGEYRHFKETIVPVRDRVSDDLSDLFDPAIEIVYDGEDMDFVTMREEEYDSNEIRTQISTLLGQQHNYGVEDTILPDDSASVAGETFEHHASPLLGNIRNSSQDEVSMEIVITEVVMDQFSYPPLAGETSHLRISVKDFEILDLLRSSVWHKFMTSQKIDGNRRETESQMFRLDLKGVIPDPKHPNVIEKRMEIALLPLRLHVDQDALIFISNFFAFELPHVDEVMGIPRKSSEMFFQNVKVDGFSLQVDYKPKHMNYHELQRGKISEALNMIHLDTAVIHLKPLRLSGISGWSRLMDTVKLAYSEHILNTQLPNILTGLTPIRSIVNMGSGLKEMLLIPAQQVQRDGRILHGLRKGTTQFISKTAVEGVKISTKLVVGAQKILENADAAVTTSAQASAVAASSVGRGSSLSEAHHRSLSKYSDAPKDITEGLYAAYESICRSLEETRAIIAVPMDPENQSGKLGQAMRAAPIAVIHPLLGISEALRYTLLGARGSLDPNANIEMTDKYKSK